uniref:Retrotransposon gag domain-containing protein n=1 Tax=Fagus sylvatica TaxID=28930 RepID=A0A2N9GRT7_FAGSY
MKMIIFPKKLKLCIPRVQVPPIPSHENTTDLRWEGQFRLDLPEFHGSLSSKDFVDWLNTMERVFEFHEVPEAKKTKLVAIKLRGRASAWWEQLQVQRLRCSKAKVQLWVKMKKKLSEQVLPYNYTQQLYQALHSLKQTGTVEEHGDKFYQLIARIDLMESEEQLVLINLLGALEIRILSKLQNSYARDVVEVKDFVESDSDELIGGDEEEEEEGLVLVMKKTLLTPRKEDENEWLRGNIFHSTCSILGKVCNLVIDGGSCENVVSQEAVDKLGLKTEEHPHPYKLSWIKKGGEIKVIKRCMVSFSIWKKYEDVVSCDVVPMDVCHLLLRRPWQYDRDTSHNGKNNTYSLKLNGKKFTLLSMKHKVTQKLDKTLLLIKSFAHDHSDSGCAYMLGADLCANNEGNEVEKNMGDVPSAIKELLEEFGDYTPIELPLGLSPMKNIQHANVSGLEGFKESYKEGGSSQVKSSLAAPSHQTKTSVITGSLLFFTILDSKIWAGLGVKCPIESTGGSLYKGPQKDPIPNLKLPLLPMLACLLFHFGLGKPLNCPPKGPGFAAYALAIPPLQPF